LENIDAATDALEGFGQIGRLSLQECGPMGLADHFLGEGQECVGRHGFSDGLQRAADAQRGRQAGFEVEVAGALVPGRGD